MNLNEFPSSPSEGDTYLIGNVTYKYTQGVWAVVSQVKTNFRAIIERLCKEAGLNMVSGSFDEGATVTNPTDVIWDEFSGKYYSWSGAFPKVVTAGSTPTTSGDIGALLWVDRTQETLRAELSESTGSSLIGHNAKTVGQAFDRQEAAISSVALADLGSAQSAGVGDEMIVTNCNFSANVKTCIIKCILDGTTKKWKTEIYTSDAAPATPSFPVDWIVDWIQG